MPPGVLEDIATRWVRTLSDYKTYRELHDLYLAVNVAGLADIMENLRKTMYDAFKIDPVHTFGLPTLTKASWEESTQQHAVASNCPGFEDYDEDEPTLALEKQDAIRMAYPTGVRDGTPIVDIPFSKNSGRQGFIKHTDARLPEAAPMPTMLQVIRNQHALIESFSVARAEHAQQIATVVHSTVAAVAAALRGKSGLSAEAAAAAVASLEGLYGEIGESSERMHGMTAALFGCGTGMSAIQRAAAFSTQLPFGAAAPIYVQSSQPALAQLLQQQQQQQPPQPQAWGYHPQPPQPRHGRTLLLTANPI
ncbi:hypothetical protein T492DRAFT_867593 [Pavlovales sp. CCMP2436]|nr:hypothetical protein T492DRAFT_867593 [Pavlovales sp. CCMP2436]